MNLGKLAPPEVEGDPERDLLDLTDQEWADVFWEGWTGGDDDIAERVLKITAGCCWIGCRR